MRILHIFIYHQSKVGQRLLKQHYSAYLVIDRLLPRFIKTIRKYNVKLIDFYLKKDLLVKTPDVTRVIVQKAVVVLAKQVR